MKIKPMTEGCRLPLLVEPETVGADLIEFVGTHKRALEEYLVEAGAILFRGFDLTNEVGFDHFVCATSDEKMDYIYGSTPRTSVGNRIYTATEYPPQSEIPLHNELSYHTRWPKRIALCCLVPASEGGETPIADMRLVSRSIGSELLDQFESRMVKYVRHYRPYIDVPWQQVFKTDSKDVVADICSQAGIDHSWLRDDVLRTEQVCQGVVSHPTTKERYFFNQAHLFHVSSLGVENAKALIQTFGHDQLPRHATFGDGGDIPADSLEIVRKAFHENEITFRWQAGDVLLLDNVQAAHGRKPFVGERRVLAALMEPC